MANNKQITRKQHYIPEKYLKSFCNAYGKIWQYNLLYGNYKPVTPAQTGYIEFLYETQWKGSTDENKQFALVNYLENLFRDRENIYLQCISSVCQKACTHDFSVSDITQDERKILAEFTTNIFLRHPNMMKVIDFDNLSEKEKASTHAEELRKLFGNEAETVLIFENKCRWLDSQFPGGYFQLIQNIFEKMCLTIIMSEHSEFITCDWPILNAQIGGEIITFLLPISPKICICYNKLLYKENVNHISDEMVGLYNKLHIEKKSSRMKYLYARNKEDIERLFKESGEKQK